MQLSTTITILLAIVVVFCFYGVILAKFYKRRRRVDTLNQVQYSTVQWILSTRYSTTQYSTVLHSTVQYSRYSQPGCGNRVPAQVEDNPILQNHVQLDSDTENVESFAR